MNIYLATDASHAAMFKKKKKKKTKEKTITVVSSWYTLRAGKQTHSYSEKRINFHVTIIYIYFLFGRF